MKKKYEELDLIEKHRVLLWSRIRERLLHHLANIERRLENYDLSGMPPEEVGDPSTGHSLKELDGFFAKMDAP